MIICDYIDEKAIRYLKNNSGRIILTFFKEPRGKYNNSKVLFIDDILNESDYKKIDEFVEGTIKAIEEIFSRYLKVSGYSLFDYLQLQAKRDLSKTYKYKYAVDKIAKEQKKNNIVFFSSEFDLLEWLKQDYIITRLHYSTTLQQGNAQIKSKIKGWIKNSRFVRYIVDQLFEDHRNMPNQILWLGGRSLQSELMDELKKEFKVFLFQNQVHRFGFAMRGIKYGLLKLKDRRKFSNDWYSLEQQYEKGLKKIASLTNLESELLEIILKINRNKIKELLTILLILQENEHNPSLLFVEQSVIGVNALAMDYFYRHSLTSLEVLHGVPGLVEVGKATKIAVYGQRDKLFLTNHGVDEAKLVITGCPYYDNFFDIEEREKSFEFFLLILDWIPFVPSSLSHRRIFTEVMHMLKLLQHLKNERLLIKLHPVQSEKELKYVQHLVEIAGINKRVEVKKNVGTTSLLKAAKIVFTFHSSVGLESLLMNKPLIILPCLSTSTIEYGKYKGCLVAENYRDLLFLTEEILRDIHGYLKKNKENIERTIGYFSGDITGESYKRIANLCREILHT